MNPNNKRKALFIDRDGTLIIEPEDFVVDSLDKLEYLPGVFTYLGKIARQLKFDLIMVTNQDGLGTAAFPEERFWPTHKRMINTLAGEGIVFLAEHIDPHFEDDNTDTRKPGIGMLKEYLNGAYDLEQSYVIGDRLTDIQLAKNLGAKGILIGDSGKQAEIEKLGLSQTCALLAQNWAEIAAFIILNERRARVYRKTNETDVSIEIAIDGTGESDISTGLGFFDHMLEQLAKHSGMNINIKVNGDLHIDEHHTIEDTAIALGQCIKEAIGDKIGLERYGYTLPMDDSLAQVAIDFGGRPWLVWDAIFTREKIGDFPTELFMHFFKSFTDSALCNLNIKVEGQNEHHKIESIFKAFAKAIKMAAKRDFNNSALPSTKGIL